MVLDLSGSGNIMLYNDEEGELIISQILRSLLVHFIPVSLE